MRPSEPIYDEAFRRSTLSANPSGSIGMQRVRERLPNVRNGPNCEELTQSTHFLFAPNNRHVWPRKTPNRCELDLGQTAFGFFEIIAVMFGRIGMSREGRCSDASSLLRRPGGPFNRAPSGITIWP